MKKPLKISLAFTGVATTAVLMAGCSGNATQVDPDKITYNQDTRTGLCFAEKESRTELPPAGYKVLAITQVDCAAIPASLLPETPDADTQVGYSYDARTNTCFAATGSRTRNLQKVVTIAAVPCTDKVKALIP